MFSLLSSHMGPHAVPRARQFLGKLTLYVWGTPSYKQPLWYYSHKHLIWEFVTGSVLKSLNNQGCLGSPGSWVRPPDPGAIYPTWVPMPHPHGVTQTEMWGCLSV